MKTDIFISFLLAIMTLFSACSNDSEEAPFLGASINVTVQNLSGTVQNDIKVYMFKNLEPDDGTDPKSAQREETTNSAGVALFKLNLTELNIIESETTLYFAVYYKIGDDIVLKAGDSSLTIKRNEDKEISITIPI